MARENILPLGAKVAEAGCPENAKGLIMICPGGGYSWLSPREAEPVAQAFLAGGYAAAIVYTTVREDDKAPLLGNLPLRQLGEAAEFCRKNYPGLKLIVCGFSAGAHLAASLGTHFSDLQLPRPDGMILGYPVITSGEYAHRGSMANLAPVGEQEWYSLERYVTAETPPVFLWHTVTDPEVPVQNSLLFAEALSRANVSYELHLYPRGVHGLSLCTPDVDEPEKNRLADPHIAGWFALCLEWLGTVL